MIEVSLPLSTRHDIDRRIDRLLADVGQPEPPLNLAHVRALLKFDLRYYTLEDPTWLEGKIHTIRLAGRNLVQEPRLLLQVVRKLSLRALFVPDRQQILIDQSLPSPKQRWGEGHELTHAILDWHAPYAHGDQERTLAVGCHAAIEAEANYGAGRMLFLGKRFIDESRSAPLSIDRIKYLARIYGNSVTATLWRATENSDQPVMGMLSTHPWDPADSMGSPRIRRMFCSPSYIKQFASLDPEVVFRKLAKVVTRRGGGLLGAETIDLADSNGDRHEFHAECFNNTHDILTLLVHRQQKPTVIVAS